jgi:hypothetical protein
MVLSLIALSFPGYTSSTAIVNPFLYGSNPKIHETVRHAIMQYEMLSPFSFLQFMRASNHRPPKGGSPAFLLDGMCTFSLTRDGDIVSFICA